MKRILFVGFKGKQNSSAQLVERYSGDKLLLTNSFGGLQRDIEALDVDFDFVYMFGLDKDLHDRIRIEKCAELDGHRLETTINTTELAFKFDRLGIPYAISDSPTYYLCNAAYYRMLRRMHCPVVFIHIPPVRFFSEFLQNQLLQLPAYEESFEADKRYS